MGRIVIMLPNIRPDQQKNYSYAFDALMDAYDIPEKQRGELQEILYYFVLKFESANHIIYEREQAVNALRFFKEYREVENTTLNEFTEKQEYIDNYNPLNEYLTVQIHSKFKRGRAILDYYGIALDTLNFLYDKIKSTDQLLHTYLKDYTSIPPLKTLNSLIKEIELKADYGYLYDIRIVANDLNEYSKTNLPKQTSKHRYHLVFDLIYLCDVFKYIRNINKHKGVYYSISNSPNKNQYLLSTRINEPEKYNVVNGLFKNEARSELYKKETRKRLREK